jgi:hypothetical protein
MRVLQEDEDRRRTDREDIELHRNVVFANIRSTEDQRGRVESRIVDAVLDLIIISKA